MTDIESCISYESSTLELVLPSPIIFSKLCVSTDRTSLFIVSFIRVIFYVILYYVINDLIDLEHERYIKYVLLTVIVVNSLYVGIVVGKNTSFSIGADRTVLEKTDPRKESIPYSI